MEASRWLLLSPLVLALAAVAAVGARSPGGSVAATGWDPPPCPDGIGGPAAGTAWFRLDPVLDRSGTLAARRLTLGIEAGPTRSLDLAPEAFASGPVGGLVVAGDDDGSVSGVRLLDQGRACAIPVATEAAVIRSAVLAPDHTSIVEHRVDRATRADLGVWRRPVGGGDAVRLLDGLPADPALGPTFSTDLVIAADGRLVVSSCAVAACRVRVLDPTTGTVTLVLDTGPALGLSGDALVVREACEGWPCPVEAIDLGTGERRILADDAYAAALAGSADERLLIETADGAVAIVEVAGGSRHAPRDAGGIPVRRGSITTAGIEAADGSAMVAAGGRPRAGAVRVVDLTTGRTRRLAEIDR